MGKIVKENGVFWYEEKQHISGVWHIHRKYMGVEEKPKEDKPKKTKKEGDI